jgi:site-specific DNA-methyltransferase (adenine-specific)
MKWKNRIIETGIANPSELIANPVNFRKHPKRQQEAINGSLDALGWIQNVIVNKRTGRIIDGHLRVDQAIAHGEAAVPVQWVDLSEEEEGQALLSLDPIAAMAETNKQTMTDIMKQINATQDALAPYLEEIAKSSGIDIWDILGKDEDDPPDESEAESFREKWGVESGQMWELGEHRVLCGDCTDNELIARLISGEDIDLCLTDPPYGIDYGAGGFSGTHGWVKREIVEWDSQRPSKKIFDIIIELSKDQIIWGGNYFTDYLPPRMRWLIWDKGQRNFSLADCELAWTSSQKASRVFTFSRAEALKDKKQHPTQKPIALMEWCLDKYQEANIILDVFLGSGTTLIACENLRRKCRGIEISPEYVAITIERWNRLTGKTPTLISTP